MSVKLKTNINTAPNTVRMEHRHYGYTYLHVFLNFRTVWGAINRTPTRERENIYIQSESHLAEFYFLLPFWLKKPNFQRTNNISANPATPKNNHFSVKYKMYAPPTSISKDTTFLIILPPHSQNELY